MRTSDGVPVRGRETILIWALCFYAVSSLISMAVMNIGAAVLIVGLLASIGWRGLVERLRAMVSAPKARVFAWVTLALVLAAALSLVSGAAAPLEFNGRTPEFHLLKDLSKVWYFLYVFVLAAALGAAGPRGRNAALRAWLIAFGLLSVIGIVQFFTGWPRPQAIPGFNGRFHATLFLGHHLSVASVWIFPLFAALDLLRERWLTRPGRGAVVLPGWFLASATVLGAVTLFLGFSRAAWVAVPAGIFLWAVIALPRKAAIAATVAVLAAAGAASTHPEVLERVSSAMGSRERVALWEANWEFFKLRPLTGVGFRKTEFLSGQYLLEKTGAKSVFAGHAHNNFLEMLGGTGALGALAWLAWIAVVFVLLWPDVRRGHAGRFAAGLFCAWVVFQINGLTQVNFWEGKVMHQMMWVVAWALWWRTEDRLAGRAS